MKFILLFLSSILLCCELSAQKKAGNNLWGVDFNFISTSLHYARRVGDDFFTGVEGGILPGVNWVVVAGRNFTEKSTPFSPDRSKVGLHEMGQLYSVHFFVRWKPRTGKVEMDGGFRIASYFYNVPHNDDRGQADFYGVFLKPLYGVTKRINVGVRLDIGNMTGSSIGNANEFVVIATPVVRFNFQD